MTLREEIERLRDESSRQVIFWSNACEKLSDQERREASVALKMADMCDILNLRLTRILEETE